MYIRTQRALAVGVSATNKLILVGKYTNNFIKSLATKKNTYDDIKNDMVLKGLKGKEYIHSIGLWDKYIDYLRKEFEK